MNNMLPSSVCSSGCESGWTLYLEHSFLSSYPSNRNNNEFVDGKGIYSKGKRSPKNEDEEEDLSMVSDASSGPQIFHEDEYYGNGSNGCLNNARIDATLPKKSWNRKKNRENPSRKVQEHPSFLDDTASSTVFNFSQRNFTLTNNQASKENMSSSGFSQEGSATHFAVLSLISLIQVFDQSMFIYQNMDFLPGRSEFHEPFGFFQSSLSGNHLQQNQWFGGKMG